ncbi:MAG TPA: hypothetical protein VHE59_19330 [Mucilaginibacter sp.]|nr:hypothetical protein [Mucilaginibacter sp.]
MKILRTLFVLFLTTISFNCFAATGTNPSPANTPEPYAGQVWISFMPVIFFAIILVFTIFKLRRDDVKLADLLTEKNGDASNNTQQQVQQQQPQVQQAQQPQQQGQQVQQPQSDQSQSNSPQRSTSRLIALLSGITTLAIGASLCTFYMYEKFVNVNSSIDFSALTTVLVTLGIGVVPYGFNQASAALKKS